MQFTINQGVVCGLTIPNGKSLTIGNFVFLPDFEGESNARHIQTVIKANTKEEAQLKGKKLFTDFLAKLSLIENSRYILTDNLSVSAQGSGITTHTITMSMKANIAQYGNKVKKAYESNPKMEFIRKTPIRLYRDGINSDNTFEKFRNFYRVLECYDYSKTGGITAWIIGQIANPEMKKNNRDQGITIYTWIRIKLSHSKNRSKDLTPFLISNPQHVAIVTKHLPKIQELARKKIKEMEGV